MRACVAVLEPPNVKQGLREVHLLPSQGNKLRNPESMAKGYQDDGCIPVPVPPYPFRRFHEAFHFGGGQEFPGSPFYIRDPPGRIMRTFPFTSSGGLKGDLDNSPGFLLCCGRTFPFWGVFGNDFFPGLAGGNYGLTIGIHELKGNPADLGRVPGRG